MVKMCRMTNDSVLRWTTNMFVWILNSNHLTYHFNQTSRLLGFLMNPVFGCSVFVPWLRDYILKKFAGIVRSLWEEFALDERKGKFRGRCCTNLQSSTHHISEGRTGKIWIMDISLFGWSTRPFWVKITWIVILT